jgi:hypothetical protein
VTVAPFEPKQVVQPTKGLRFIRRNNGEVSDDGTIYCDSSCLFGVARSLLREKMLLIALAEVLGLRVSKCFHGVKTFQLSRVVSEFRYLRHSNGRLTMLALRNERTEAFTTS